MSTKIKQYLIEAWTGACLTAFLALGTYLILCLEAHADDAVMVAEDGAATTNIISNVKELKAWRENFVAVTDSGELRDASGKIASVAADAAVEATVEYSSTILDAAHSGVTNSLAGLSTATNGVTDRMESFSLQFIRKSPLNLMGYVITNWFDGVYDWQWVRYNYSIAKAPKRTMVYTYPSGDVSVECAWTNWTTTGSTINRYGGCHLCYAKRPSTASKAKCLPIVKEIFGGDKGFDFGAMTVFVDEAITATGVYTGNTHVVTINNGVIQKWERK